MRFLTTLTLAFGASMAAADMASKFQDRIKELTGGYDAPAGAAEVKREADTKPAHRFLNAKSKKFAVDGANIPLVPFDVGESYAGSLPISDKKGENSTLFFWFFPAEGGKVTDDVTVWLNGGPGCSSLSGFLTENGPFLWQDGTLAPVKNPYSWHKLTNMIWIEQPVGTGFSLGTPSANDELELATQFRGFWKNFVDTFELKGAKTYLTGESYAGYYVPYIANSFILQNDTDYFNLGGISINDPTIGDDTLQFDITEIPYHNYWAHLLGHEADTLAKANAAFEASGQANYTNTYFTFPPPQNPFPPAPNGIRGISSMLSKSARDKNPCFNIYHITDQCPHVYAHLGGVNGGDYIPVGSEVYFTRSDVQKHINAPLIGKRWRQCGGNNGSVFPNGDSSPGPALDGTLQNIIETTNNTIVGSGALDLLLQTNGTLFALQNVTWNGFQGFHSFPKTPFFVPDHENKNGGALGPRGNIGVYVKERGLTFYDIHLAGHEVPGYSLSGGYRMLQVLLGKVEDFSSTDPLF
ncbi:Putative Serine carboxypeptidase [[Torrubiella] hemipterigena]|uniref:Carboxypeptidase n=1 Tax=[Torrubiella] hemipterigena TaxID=1531966 RepID=A0A0A1TMQ5_9HYPO|nr:Putative Serine carboxypeptidase [[Torrubiella] hemipterigena]